MGVHESRRIPEKCRQSQYRRKLPNKRRLRGTVGRAKKIEAINDPRVWAFCLSRKVKCPKRETPTACFLITAMQKLLKFRKGIQQVGAITGLCDPRHHFAITGTDNYRIRMACYVASLQQILRSKRRFSDRAGLRKFVEASKRRIEHFMNFLRACGERIAGTKNEF